jgi:hypothetical protein
MTGSVSRVERRLEIFGAVLMSLATVATAWCAFQSAQWGGEQSFLLGESQRAGREASLQSALAAQKRALDVSIFMQWIGALASGNDSLQAFYEKRFPPNLEVAVRAWAATEPRSNPAAPPHPFAMAEYRVTQDSLAEAAARVSQEKWEQARVFDDRGDRYVLLTVIFASVLFFAGIAQKFESTGVHVSVLAMGTVLFLAALAVMATYPIWW